MVFADPLYTVQMTDRKISRIIHRLLGNKKVQDIYVICRAVSDSDLLDIIPSFMLAHYAERKLCVLGLAQSKDEAYEICSRIVHDAYTHTGTYDIRSFIQSKF